jgi:hypothetical protein
MRPDRLTAINEQRRSIEVANARMNHLKFLDPGVIAEQARKTPVQRFDELWKELEAFTDFTSNRNTSLDIRTSKQRVIRGENNTNYTVWFRCLKDNAGDRVIWSYWSERNKPDYILYGSDDLSEQVIESNFIYKNPIDISQSPEASERQLNSIWETFDQYRQAPEVN